MGGKETIDDYILEACTKRFMKVARIIVDVSNKLGQPQHDDNGLVFEKRIRSLIEAGKLECAGDLSRWRFSEIRLTSTSEE